MTPLYIIVALTDTTNIKFYLAHLEGTQLAWSVTKDQAKTMTKEEAEDKKKQVADLKTNFNIIVEEA